MGRKKLNKNVCLLIEKCVISRQRALFLIVGQKARDQVALLHHILQKSRNHIESSKPSVLWCFKRNHGYRYIVQKTQRMLKKKNTGNFCVSENDIFDQFIASVNIQFCHYGDSSSVLGQTFGMLVVQDFEALTPNILARIIECVEGGGIIALILPDIQSLQEISLLKMDAHCRFITSSHPEVDPMFNKRFVLSLQDCKSCIIMNDNLRVLLCPSNLDFNCCSQTQVAKNLEGKLKSSRIECNDVLEKISALCCTTDQANAVQLFIKTLKEKCRNSIVSLTSARGRGKSTALGLAISAALYINYSNIYVTSPQVDNLQTLFSFIIKGIKTFGYKEGEDYSISYKTVENTQQIFGVYVFHDHRQTVQYFNPTEFAKVKNPDLVVIDEAAAIPLPLVKMWMDSNMVFMASTINGYEGTGRSLSLKLLNQLRKQSLQDSIAENNVSSPVSKKVTLHEATLNEAIRYADGDSVESWLNSLFCLDSEISYMTGELPKPEQCQLYYINKKILFSYNKVAEKFLQQVVALFVSSHYKNSPNDLLMMADAPSHHIFCLLPPIDNDSRTLPNVLCVIQVSYEGRIAKDTVLQELSHGRRASGDLLAWIISQQFQNNDFLTLSGARIVRIATHPNYQRMGYGQQALKLLFSYFKNDSETNLQYSEGKNKKCALMLKLNEIEPQELDYVGVSYGLTLELFKFWKKLEFFPLYLRQTTNEITGEHSCVMIRSLNSVNTAWLPECVSDFLDRFVALLPSAFKNLHAYLVLEILDYKRKISTELKDMQTILNACSIRRLEAYCTQAADIHLIMDLLPLLSKSYFLHHFKDYFLSSIQEAILLCFGLQNKVTKEISVELQMETDEILVLVTKIMRKILRHLTNSAHISKKNRKISAHKDFKNSHKSGSFLCDSVRYKRMHENSVDDKKKKLKNIQVNE